MFYFPSKKQLTEKQLLEISPSFENINGEYIGFSIAAIALLIFAPMLLIESAVDPWALAHFGMRFYPWVVLFNVGYAIYQASFALYKGVYPMGKGLSYAYEDKAVIWRVAVQQIAIALAALGIAVLFYFATLL